MSGRLPHTGDSVKRLDQEDSVGSQLLELWERR
jgi:hypothetical protein